jgi:protein-disulfide isomerase
MCILTYLVNFALLYYAWFINRRFGNAGLFSGLLADLKFLWDIKKASLPVIAVFVVIIAGTVLAMPEYWKTASPPLDGTLTRGETEDGHPWIGSENPDLVIEEFTDFLCSQCRIKHFYLRRLIAEHPDRIRLVHRHFPMDNKYNPLVKEPYHIGSGILSVFSIHAQKHGKFWEANDMFFQLDKSAGAINTRTIAEKLELEPRALAAARINRNIFYRLQKDIEEGLKLGFTGTPGYLINGQTYQGRIPPEVLKILKN